MSETHIWIDVDGPLRETEKAVKYETDVGTIWIPKSVIGASAAGRLELARWWAEKTGIVDPKDAR